MMKTKAERADRSTASRPFGLRKVARFWAAGAALCLIALALPATIPPVDAAGKGAAGAATCGDAVLNLQQCIDAAAAQSLRDKGTAPIDAVTATLRTKLQKDTGNILFYRTYWLAYADYRTAQISMLQRRPDVARKAAFEGESILQNMAGKSEETYALQSLIVYVEYGILPKSETGKLIGKSLQLKGKFANATSPRAIYARALSDWNTPKEYGGGRAAEALLRGALAAPDERGSPLKPTWGKEDCATLLIGILKSSGRADEAATLKASWSKKRPNSLAFKVAS